LGGQSDVVFLTLAFYRLRERTLPQKRLGYRKEIGCLSFGKPFDLDNRRLRRRFGRACGCHQAKRKTNLSSADFLLS
jgi:hypothetical protein